MKHSQRPARSLPARAALSIALLTVTFTLSACGHAMMMLHGNRVQRPAASDFGLGPRTSASGRYVATLEPVTPLRPRQMQTVRVTLRDAGGRVIEEAGIAISGGMPQHGHGLPTRPRVTRSLGGGLYEIDGVRFNMGGWWEFTLAIASASGADVITDTVTFNLQL